MPVILRPRKKTLIVPLYMEIPRLAIAKASTPMCPANKVTIKNGDQI